MKNSFKILAAIAAFGFVGTANAQTSASADATASARIVTPIQIKKHCDLGFGSIVAGSGGEVTVNENGRSATDGVQLTDQQGSEDGRVGMAKFNVCGEPNFTYSINTPATVALGTMSVSINAPNAGALDANGKSSFNVGGTLTVPSNAPSGYYTAEVEATVAYN